VSALISGAGPPALLLKAVRKRRLPLITSSAQIAELRRVLSRDTLRERFGPGEAEMLLETINAIAVVVENLPACDLSSDPADNLILAAAIASNADLIVSGDKKDMLALGTAQGIPIVTAREAVSRLQT
jgi:putative PIN family toxin of toxin-antitoxin system